MGTSSRSYYDRVRCVHLLKVCPCFLHRSHPIAILHSRTHGDRMIRDSAGSSHAATPSVCRRLAANPVYTELLERGHRSALDAMASQRGDRIGRTDATARQR
eukprot:757822-Pyramimonas_sp.AAC.1